MTSLRLLVGLGLALTATGCPDDAAVRTYSVPRRPPAELITTAPPGHDEHDGHDHGATPSPHGPAAVDEALAWDLPPGWRAGDARAMRLATLVAPDGLELAITTFPGDVGGVLANVNRWRSQLGLEAVSEADLGSAVTRLDGARLEVLVVDVTSKDGGQRMLAAILPRPTATWFVKTSGPVEQVERAREAVLGCLRSMRVEGGAPPVAKPPEVPAGATAGPTFTTPDGWEVLPARPPQLAALRAGAGEGAPQVTITCFPGAVGDELANVNRWRGQVGLPPLAALEGQRRAIEVQGHAGALHELEGAEAAILVVSVRVGESTWFAKMMGPRAQVARERERFEAFARSLKLGGS